MYICDGCGNSNINLEDGENNCPECGRLIIVRSYKPDSPMNLPKDINSLSTMEITQVLSRLIKTPSDVEVVATLCGFSGQMPGRQNDFHFLLFSLVQCFDRFGGWKDKYRSAILQWYELKSTTP